VSRVQELQQGALPQVSQVVDMGSPDRRYIVLEQLGRIAFGWCRCVIMNTTTGQVFDPHEWTMPHPIDEPTDDELALYTRYHLAPETLPRGHFSDVC
jgi:hypothetical protein